MLTPGAILQNRYRILSLVAHGGMGAVYQAIDQRFDNKVALKESFFKDARLDMAFEREARILNRLRHQALPVVFDYFTEDEGIFLVMQFIPGDDLGKVMEKRQNNLDPIGQPKPFDLDEVLAWSDQLLDALAYLHKQKPPVIHRDIKPQNLKLTEEGQIVLLDFGLAKGMSLQSSITTGSSILGYTPNYAPLEQVKGAGTDPRSDLYSLAATLYHLMTGITPADAVSRADKVLNEEEDPLRLAHELNPKVSPSVAAVLHEAMSQKKDRRPNSAAAMRAALRAADRTTTTVPPPINQAITSEPQWAERYSIIRPLGEGGMSETYEARDIQTGDIACLKRLRASIDQRPLMQECRAIARLRHANIVKLIDFDLRPPTPYLILEFVKGPSLSEYMAVHHPVAEPVVVMMARQLFDAVAYAHEQSIIHCDLKPGNIILTLIGSNVALKILDYGLAIIDRRDDRGAITAAGRVAGTYQYMAPEQFEGEVLGEACDIYALGQILWEMVAGRPAFGDGVEAVVRSKMELSDGLDLLRERQGASESLAGLIRWCTRRDPSERPKAREVLELINRVSPEVTLPAVAAPLNMGFDLPVVEGKPPGWFNSLGFVDGVSAGYEIEILRRMDIPFGSCVRMESSRADKGEFGSLMQRCPAWHLSGKRVRLEGWVSTRDVNEWGGLWLRADGKNGMLFFDNMHDRPIRGTTQWTSYHIEVQLPVGTEWINYGILLVGRGEIRADDFRLRVQDDKTGWNTLGLWNELAYPSTTGISMPTT